MAPAALVEPGVAPPIADRIALGALTSTFPPDLVDRVIEQTGRAEQRRRLLPARVVVYYVLALALFANCAYEEVMRCLVEGLGWAYRARRGRRSWPYWHVPGASALGEARARLGPEPLRVLDEQAAGIVACDLLHRRHHLAAAAVCAVLHRAGHPPGAPGRGDRQPRRRLGRPAGPQPHARAGRPRTTGALPTS